MDIPLIRNETPSRTLNDDEPHADVSLGEDLRQVLQQIDTSRTRSRLPVSSNRSVSVRIIPDADHESNPTSLRSHQDGQTRASPLTRVPEKTMTPSERAYLWRMKFIRLNRRNKDIPIPETVDPDALERLYAEAARTDHYCSTSATWLIYMGIGYVGFQYALNKLGFNLPGDFAFIQLEVMSHYPEILKSLGDPGGPSMGSSWPPWLKLLFVIGAHTIIFVLIYKITGSSGNARQVQQFICSTGLMGGKPQGQELEADNAMTNLGGIFNGILGGGGGGLGGLVQNIMGQMMGPGGPPIDLDNPPLPVVEDEPVGNPPTDSLNRPNMFD